MCGGAVAPSRTGITSFNTNNQGQFSQILTLIFVLNHSKRFVLAKSHKGHYMKPIGQRYLDLIEANRDQFSDDFVEWLPKNGHIWHYFAIETFKIIDIGFKHYSARTILHFLRHHTAIEQRSMDGFKLNNNYSPYLARLWALSYPDRGYIFEYRKTPKAKSDNRDDEE